MNVSLPSCVGRRYVLPRMTHLPYTCDLCDMSITDLTEGLWHNTDYGQQDVHWTIGHEQCIRQDREQKAEAWLSRQSRDGEHRIEAEEMAKIGGYHKELSEVSTADALEEWFTRDMLQKNWVATTDLRDRVKRLTGTTL